MDLWEEGREVREGGRERLENGLGVGGLEKLADYFKKLYLLHSLTIPPTNQQNFHKFTCSFPINQTSFLSFQSYLSKTFPITINIYSNHI